MSESVRIRAHARLHMGFLDLNGTLSREFGSIGVSLNELYTDIEIARVGVESSTRSGAPETNPIAVETNETIPEREILRAVDYANRIRTYCASDAHYVLRIHRVIPGHVGLGSGTQLSLAIGTGITKLEKREDISEEQIAEVLGRGQRSGVGVHTFKQGGFVMDGGKGGTTLVPPLLTRMVFPENWRILLLLDSEREGLSGNDEVRAFENLPVFPSDQAAHLCRLALMQLLPGLAERNAQLFGRAVTEIQNIVGDHFAPAQGGRYTSSSISRWLYRFPDLGACGIGQSSWGPTGFVLFESEQQMLDALEKAGGQGFDDQVSWLNCSVNNASTRIDYRQSQREVFGQHPSEQFRLVL